MDLGAGALFGAVMVVLALALLGTYAGARLRKGKAPAHAKDAAHVGDEPGGDQDVIPRESGGGEPMVTPAEEPRDQSVDEMQRRARRNAS